MATSNVKRSEDMHYLNGFINTQFTGRIIRVMWGEGGKRGDWALIVVQVPAPKDAEDPFSETYSTRFDVWVHDRATLNAIKKGYPKQKHRKGIKAPEIEAFPWVTVTAARIYTSKNDKDGKVYWNLTADATSVNFRPAEDAYRITLEAEI